MQLGLVAHYSQQICDVADWADPSGILHRKLAEAAKRPFVIITGFPEQGRVHVSFTVGLWPAQM